MTGSDSVAFSPDGHTLAAGSQDKTVTLWDATDPTDPQRIGQPLTGPTNAVDSVAFSPDGHTLAAGSADHTVTLWETTGMTDLLNNLIVRACSITNRGLTTSQWATYIPGLPYENACAN